jgi:hypothetical protein
MRLQVLAIPKCRVHHPSINRAAELVRKCAKDLKVRPFDGIRPTHTVEYRGTSLIRNSPPPRTIIGPYVQSYCRVLAGRYFL